MTKPTTNQKKGIVHRGSGHIAESTGVSLPYFEKGQEGAIVMDDNHIEVRKCAVSMAAQRTFIEGHQVIHHHCAIGHPYGDGNRGGNFSRYDRPHGNAKNNPPVFMWFAYPNEKSPDVKVEGKWVVRTFDKTLQDVNNGPGLFSPGAGSAEITDESELLFQQCAVEKIELICSHERSTMEGELHVFIGDMVTVKAYRVNASETDPKKRLDIHCHLPLLKEKKKPPAEETRHAAFVLSRNRGGIPPLTLSWSAIESKTLVGRDEIVDKGEVPTAGRAHVTELFLDKEWLLEAEEEIPAEIGAGDGLPGKDRDYAERKLARAQGRERSARRAPGRSGKKSGALGQARRDVTNAQRQLDAVKADDEKRKENAKASQAIVSGGKLLLESWSIITGYFGYQPLTINIEAHGCSPGATATVKAYPNQEFGAELAVLKDFPFTKTVEKMSNLVDKITNFFQAIDCATVRRLAGANPGYLKRSEFDIDVYFFRGKKDDLEDSEPSVALTFGFQELTRESNPDDGEVAGRKPWQIHKFWEIEVKLERLFGLKINFEVDLSFCAGIGKVIAAILTFCGVKTGVFLNININLSVGIGGSVSRDEYGKWDTNFGSIPVKSVIDVAIIARAGKFFSAELHLTGSWEPELGLAANEKGQLCLERSEANIKLAITFTAKVDVLGWNLEASYTVATWEIPVPGSPLVVFGDGK